MIVDRVERIPGRDRATDQIRRDEYGENQCRIAAAFGRCRPDLGGFYTSPAILTEFIHCFLATDLSPVAAPAAEEDEGIEVVRWPLVNLQVAIEKVRDAKTLIGLMRLERELRAGGSLASRR